MIKQKAPKDYLKQGLKGRPKISSIEEYQAQRAYQFQICLWIALNRTTRQILDGLQDKYGLKRTQKTIDRVYRYGKKWKKTISYLRVRYLNNIAHIPIVHQARRLALLNEAAEEALTWRIKTVSQFGRVYEKKIGTIPPICNEVRKELGLKDDKEKIVEKHTHYTNISISSGEHSEKDLIDIIFGRANARNLAEATK